MVDRAVNVKMSGAQHPILSAFHELIVDILGCLLPGFLFLILGLVTLLGPLLLVLQVLARDIPRVHGLFLAAVTAAAGFQWVILIFFLAASYVVGVIFFRRDPKEPDSYSASYIYEHANDADKLLLAVARKTDATAPVKGPFFQRMWAWLMMMPKRREDLDAQFPYINLKKYLESRKLKHLASVIPWTPHKAGGRSKMFINVLKVRLLASVPERCQNILVNEAQVRLTTSVWYASMWLSGAAVAGLFLWALGLTLAVTQCFDYGSFIPNGTEYSFRCYSTFPAVGFWIMGVYVGSIVIRKEIVKFLHYQRVREVVWLLELAYWVEKGWGGTDGIKGLLEV